MSLIAQLTLGFERVGEVIKPLLNRSNCSIAYDVQNVSGQPANGNIADIYDLNSTLAPLDATSVTFTTEWDNLNSGSTFADGKLTCGTNDAGIWAAIIEGRIVDNDNRDLLKTVVLNGNVVAESGLSATGTLRVGGSLVKLLPLVAADEVTFQIAHDRTNNRDHAGSIQFMRMA